MYANHALSPRGQWRNRDALRSNELFLPSGCFPASRTQHQPHQNYSQHSEWNRPRQRHADAHSARREWRAYQEDCAQKHRYHASESQDSVARGFRLQYKKRKREPNQKKPGKIYRQKMHGIQSKNQTNSPDDSWSDDSRMCEFRVESQDTQNQKYEENIRLHDSGKKS